MNRFFSFPVKFILGAALAVVLNGCNDNGGGGNPAVEEGKYSAIVCVGSWPNTAYYIADVPSLTSGTISLQGNGAEMTGKVYAQDIIQKDGFYYHANFGSGRFGKYHVENGSLIVDKEVPFTHLNWSTYAWADDQTLVVFGNGVNGTKNEARYAVVKVADMSMTLGKLDLAAFPAGFDDYSMGFAEYRAGKLFLGYGFASSDFSVWPNMPVYKQLNVAVIDYASMKVENNLSDTRTSNVAGPAVYAKSSFQDEAGDIYFVTDPAYNYDSISPSSVYRIKAGATVLDPTYYFDFSSKTNDEKVPAMWYIGDGKAIVRSRIKGSSIDSDHYFCLIDVKTGTFIKKLAVPVDKGQRMVNAVVVEDGKAYFAVNGDAKDYIWEYDPATDKLTSGAEFVGGIDFILRLEKTK